MKYIIEIPDDVQYVLFNGKADNKYYTAVRPVAELEELNSDYINENFGELQDEAYQAGMDKAWGLAEDVIYNRSNVLDILHCATVGAAFDKYSAGQALDILRAYKKKQIEKDRIEVGDEVATETGIKYTVVSFGHGGTVCGFNTEGKWTGWKPKEVTKTGKHYDIQSILEAMRT